MRNLFNFIARHYFFFLFVALQVVAFAMIFQNNYYQRSAFVNSSNYLAGNVYELRSNISSYFNLKQVNQQLVRENAILLESIPGTFLKTDQQVFTLSDSQYRTQFSYYNAKVINNSVRNRNNYMTLNKGRIHGIKPDMGVITPQGVIGIVKEVSGNFSSVISFLHSDVQISAKIKKNDQLGTVLWEGYDYKNATMLYIPPHVQLNKGDTIVTSGFSSIFPEGIMIGTIADYEIRRGDNFFTIDVELSVDFNQINFVYIVKNIYKEELMKLEESTQQ
jgi:rod shape-determining protein MreC